MKRLAIILSILSFPIFSFCGTIPDSLRTNWANPGNSGTPAIPTRILSISDFGGANDSSADNSTALKAAIDSLRGEMGVICFPEGKFLFKKSIQLPSNTILRGQGSEKTKIYFDLNKTGNFLYAQGVKTNISTTILSGYKKDSDTINIADSNSWAVGDYALVKEDGNTLMDPSSTWAFQHLYQIVKIKGIAGNHLTLEKPLRLNFQSSLNPILIKIIPVQHIGIECLSIERLDTTTSQTSSIIFGLAANCWVKGIESRNSNFGHIVLENSTQCTLSGNYLHDAFQYGGGGQGYGIVLQFGSGENLIYNNILRHLRHCILMQAAANGNVIAYNYTREPFWTENFLPADAAGDIVLHGNYNFTNLIEGNICQNIIIDNSHSYNGPYNTFFRNRAEYYGIIMNTGAGDKMNFVANEITNTNFLLGNFSLTGANFMFGNNQHGTVIPGGTTNIPENTLIGSPFSASIGLPYTIGINKNDAYLRWFNASTTKTICEGNDPCAISTSLISHKQTLVLEVFPNPSTGEFTFNINSKNNSEKELSVYDITGTVIQSYYLGSENIFKKILNLSYLPKGTYIVILRSKEDAVYKTITLQ